MQKRILRYKILCGLLLFCIQTLFFNESCSAYIRYESIKDSGTISPISFTSTPPTASISLSKASLTSDAITPGNTATTSINVTVNVSNASSYSLTLSFDKTNITSGSTTITGGNAVTNNTWGYKWDNAASYSTPTTNGSALAVPTLSDNSASFTKTLAFAAKFATNAEAGHYKANGTLSLTASPKLITLADITQMQQLASGYAPSACANTQYLSGQNYSAEYSLMDVRDGNTYTVRKLADGKCWMTSNLILSERSTGTTTTYTGRLLNSTTSDITVSEWDLAASSTTGFSDNTASNIYYYYVNNTGYYTWCAATAGTCTSATSDGQEAPSSICPKGWKLPTGGSSGEFQALATAAGITNDAAGSTKIRGIPYNFAYTGYINYSSTDNLSNDSGRWWSRTAYDSSRAYDLYIYSGGVYPTVFSVGSSRNNGYAVRCVAQ